MPRKPAVLFVCLGNICRSPLAEAAFRAEVVRIGLDVEVDSAGTGDWHVGKPPDRRAQAVANRYGSDISFYRARQVTRHDFQHFSHIIALDLQTLAALEAMRPTDGDAELSLLLDYVEGRKGEAVADPYLGEAAGFEVTWADVKIGAEALASALPDPFALSAPETHRITSCSKRVAHRDPIQLDPTTSQAPAATKPTPAMREIRRPGCAGAAQDNSTVALSPAAL